LEFYDVSANIPRDPPAETPTEVQPLIVYGAPSSASSLGNVQIIGYRSSVGGTVQASLFNAAEVTAATFIRDHVHVNVDAGNSTEKAMADELIDTLFNAIRNAALKGGKTFQDALGNIYRGSDLVHLLKNVDFNIYDHASALAAGISTLRGAETTFSNFGDIYSHATVTFELGGLAATLGDSMFLDGGLHYAMNHEIGHAMPAGHQIALLDWTSFQQTDGAGLSGAALTAAWANSAQFEDSEAFANTLGHEVSSFTDTGWLIGISPHFGYWHGVM
jgi:hypothetical protein